MDWDLQYAKWIPDASLSISTVKARAEGLLAFPSATLRKHWDHAIGTARCTRAPTSYTADFLRRRNDSRDMLGCAFQDLAPGTAKTSIRLVTSQLPTISCQMGKGAGQHLHLWCPG